MIPYFMDRWNWQWQRLKNENESIFLDWIFPTKLIDFAGKTVLDAGCGNGGYLKIVANYADKVIGLEKYATEAARENIVKHSNIEIVEGDIENIKFSEQFNAIYSVGVLHHLVDPDRGMKNLIDNLKIGGFINVWVYAKEGNWFMIKIIEPLKKFFLLRLPLPILKVFANILTMFLYILVWTVYLIPLNLLYADYFQKFRKHSYQRNLMNVFDKLNAPLTHWITEDQIKDWFKDLDSVIIRHYNRISWSGFGIKKQ